MLLDDQQAIQDAITEIEEQAVSMRRDLVAEGSLAEDFPIPYLTWTEIADSLPRLTALELSASGERMTDDIRHVWRNASAPDRASPGS